MKKLKGHDIVIVKTFHKTIRTEKTDFWKVQDIAEAVLVDGDISDMGLDIEESYYKVYKVFEEVENE